MKSHIWIKLYSDIAELDLAGECSCSDCNLALEKYKCQTCGYIRINISGSKAYRYHLSNYGYNVSEKPCNEVLLESVLL